MLADAGASGRLGTAVAAALLSGIVIAIVALFSLYDRVTLAGAVDLSDPPTVRARQARDLLTELGHNVEPVDSAWGFGYDYDHLDNIAAEDDPDRWRDIASRRPVPVTFWYRESPRHFSAERFQGMNVTPTDPPLAVAGMSLTGFDVDGHLLQLLVVPPERDESPPARLALSLIHI